MKKGIPSDENRAILSDARVHTHVHTHTHTHTQPRYLKISSILFQVLLDTQAQLLHPLQLGLDSGAISLQRPGHGQKGRGLTGLPHMCDALVQLHFR